VRHSEPAAIQEALAAVGSEYEAVGRALQQRCDALGRLPARPAPPA